MNEARQFVINLIGLEKTQEFERWAFGDAVDSLSVQDVPNAWNKLHGEELSLEPDGDVKEDLTRCIEIWERREDE